MNGALPPSSMLVFLMVGAHCASSFAPTSVDPVKVSLRTSGLPVSSPPVSPEGPVITLQTPAGMPARSARTASASAENGGWPRRPDHAGAAGSPAGASLAGDHGGREVPGRDGGEDADRLLC